MVPFEVSPVRLRLDGLEDLGRATSNGMNKIGSIALGALIVTLGLTSLVNPGYQVGFDKGTITEGLGLLSYSYLSLTNAVANGVAVTGGQMAQVASIFSGVVSSEETSAVAFIDAQTGGVISQIRQGGYYKFRISSRAVTAETSFGIVFIDNNGRQGGVANWQTGPEQLHNIPDNFPTGEFAIKQVYLGDNVIWSGLLKLRVVVK